MANRNQVRANDIPDSIFKDYKRLCKKESRSMNQQSRVLIKNWVEQQRLKEKKK